MSSNNNTSIALDILQLQIGSRYICLVLGFVLLISGVLGNIVNIIVFINNGNYKTNASSFYMLVRSFCDLNVLVIGLTTRILSTGFQIDLTIMSRFWCKVRSSFLDINTESTYTFLCLQSIDAFICSSPSVPFRQKSNIRIGRYLVFSFFLFWFIHEIPYYFLQDLITSGNTLSCITTNVIFSQYRSYFIYLGIYTTIPIIIISIFGFLTLRHMRMVAVKQTLSSVAKQIINMALFQIITVLLFNGPYAGGQIYSITTSNIAKDAYRRAQDQLVSSFFAIYGYDPYVSSFYCYCLSKRFRNQVIVSIKQIIFGIHQNQIVPVTVQSRSVPPVHT